MKGAPLLSVLMVYVMWSEDSEVYGERVPVPCLDTKSNDLTMKIQATDTDTAQEVFGWLTSWGPNRSTIRFHSKKSGADETIEVKSLQFKPAEVAPQAQEAAPIYESIGSISDTYKVTEIEIVDGVLKFPNCTSKQESHQLMFDGGITFSGKTVEVQGRVLRVILPKDDDRSHPTRRKGS